VTKTDELYARVTDQICAAIEAGAGEWSMPWQAIADAGTPMSVDGRPYRGMNVLWLTMEAADRGYTSGRWATYNAWKRNGAQVRKGETSTPVFLWKPVTKREADDTGEDRTRSFWIVKTYNVFGAEQCDGAERFTSAERPTVNSDERIAAAEGFVKAWAREVPITERGSSAFYDRGVDRIVVPPFASFRSAPDFYSTVAHEAVHSTGHDKRLARVFGKRFGDDAYAMEELTAELGAAFWCGANGISQTPRPDHAAYLAHWLRVLRSDAKALQTVASKAQAAVDLLHETASVSMAAA
jgi:antirestriction protein ArdC